MSTLRTVLERAGRYARKQTFKKVYRRHRDATMLDERAYVANLRLVADWMRTHDPSAGSIVECGTWRGGMLFGLVETCPSVMEFHAFDSFAGLPPAGPLDGEEPARLQARGELVAGNNVATLDEFKAGLARLPADRAARVAAHRGWFADTLPGFRTGRPIAILRLDCDWYDSMTLALDALFDQVSPGGLVILDDYLIWDGCARAVHDFLSRRKARERIQQFRSGRIPYILKAGPLPSP
jgi:hypothetical protein